MKRILLVSIAVFIFVMNSFAQPVKETYLFAVKGTDSLYLDRMYDPSKMAEGDTPLMIHMFGGGFAFGSRGGDYSYLTEIGVQVVSIDYRLGLKDYGYGPAPAEVRQKATEMALDDLTDAMAYVIGKAKEWNVDMSKIMLQGSSAGGLTTLSAIYDICNGGQYSKKFPADWMPAGYIGYAGGLSFKGEKPVWNRKPCPMMFFHGTADTSVPYTKRMSEGGGMYGASAICDQLQEMGVPYWLYSESGGDHVLSYKAYFGYNTAEIQTFVKKWVIQGLPLQMTTMELNLVEPSHLPGANQQRPAAAQQK